MLGIESVDEDELYAAMDWLLERQCTIEQRLAKRHLSDGALVLYDLTTSWNQKCAVPGCLLAGFVARRAGGVGRC